MVLFTSKDPNPNPSQVIQFKHCLLQPFRVKTDLNLAEALLLSLDCPNQALSHTYWAILKFETPTFSGYLDTWEKDLLLSYLMKKNQDFKAISYFFYKYKI